MGLLWGCNSYRHRTSLHPKRTQESPNGHSQAIPQRHHGGAKALAGSSCRESWSAPVGRTGKVDLSSSALCNTPSGSSSSPLSTKNRRFFSAASWLPVLTSSTTRDALVLYRSKLRLELAFIPATMTFAIKANAALKSAITMGLFQRSVPFCMITHVLELLKLAPYHVPDIFQDSSSVFRVAFYLLKHLSGAVKRIGMNESWIL